MPGGQSGSWIWRARATVLRRNSLPSTLEIFKWLGLRWLDVEAGLGYEPSMRPGRYCIRFRRVFTSAVSWSRLCLARLAADLFRCDHASSTGWSSAAYGGWLVDGQPHSGAAISSCLVRLTCVFRLSHTRTTGPSSRWCAASSRRA